MVSQHLDNMVYSLYNLSRYFYSNLIRTPTSVSPKVTVVSARNEAVFTTEFAVRNAEEDACSSGEVPQWRVTAGAWLGIPTCRQPVPAIGSLWISNLVFRTPLLALILLFLIPKVTLVLTCQLTSWEVLSECLRRRALAWQDRRGQVVLFLFFFF